MTWLEKPDVVVYADTGSEPEDNLRFRREFEEATGIQITVLRSDKYSDTWDVWTRRRYISGKMGAPCTMFLKRIPVERFLRPDDVSLFGFTAEEQRRADALLAMKPGSRFPLIEKGLNKAACFEILSRLGIRPPHSYQLGFDHANCIPCCKATSPRYWGLVRKHYPEEFQRMRELESELDYKLCRVRGEWVALSEVPPLTDDPAPTNEPACDFLCQIALGN